MSSIKSKNRLFRFFTALLYIIGLTGYFAITAGFAPKPQSPYPNSGVMNQKILFNGKNLQGWKTAGSGKWKAADGEIVGENDPASTERGWLVTDSGFRNFVLRLKYKITRGGDSGVCFRVPPDRARYAESSGYEVEILNDKDAVNGSGSIFNIQRAYERIEKDNEWNRLSIRALGDRITVILNDSSVIDVHNRRSLAGAVGFQTPDKNSVVRFKDITILPLPNTGRPGKTLEEKMDSAPGRWISLFNEKDLSGWHIIWGNPKHPQRDITKEPNFVVEDGKIVGKNSAAPGWIITTREFKNFVFRIKWRMPLGGNSGIAVRYPFPVTFSESLRGPAHTGFEIQAISRNPEIPLEEFMKSKKQTPYYKKYGIFHNLCGSIYDTACAWPNLEKAGEWNEYIIYAYGDRMITYVNGIKAAETHIPPGRSLKGSVGMQIHGGGDSAEYFEFKDIFIKEVRRLE